LTEALAELLSAAADRELSDDESAVAAAALDADPAARSELAAVVALRTRLRALPLLPMPAGLVERALGRLDPSLQEVPATPLPARQRAARPARRPWYAAGAIAGAVAAAACLALVALPSRHAAPPGAASDSVPWELQAERLAKRHLQWHQDPAETPQAASSDELADRLTREVGYTVEPPDLQALGAKVRACTACTQTVKSGRPVALFLLDRGGRAMTLFQVTAPDGAVACRGFAPCAESGVMVARRDGVTLAMWHQARLHAVLAADGMDEAELAALAPHAVRLADSPFLRFAADRR
jgi:anti-sigma factor RsiW